MSARSLSQVLRAAALGVVVARLARRPRAAVVRASGRGERLTVVVPARNEADRIRPLLSALRGAAGVVEVIVVDDGSDDDTALVAAHGGARVVAGTSPPAGWTGKTWALHQGLSAATTDWVVTIDADVAPDPELPSAMVRRARVDGLDLLSVAGRSELADAPARWLHAAMLAQLVYRFGSPGTSRRVANGQCTAGRREVLSSALDVVRGELVEDVALIRHLTERGRTVDFLDAGELMVVRPYGSATDVFAGWGRSLGLPGIERWWRQAVELGIAAATVPLPSLRVLARRGDVVDVAALMIRLGTLVGMRRAYVTRGPAYWASPLADGVALVATAWGLLNPSPTWSGRRVGRPTRPARRPAGLSGGRTSRSGAR